MTARLGQAINRAVGTKQTLKAVSEDQAQVVYLANDAEERVITPISQLCGQKNVEVVYIESMRELGEICGIDVGAAAAALLK